MKKMLKERKYSKEMVDAALRRAKAVPWKEALRKVDHPNQPYKRPIFAITWDPCLPNLSDIQMKHWRSIKSQDRYLGQVFHDPPLIAYKRQRNIGDFLIRAKVPKKPSTRPQRNQNRMKKCGKCIICAFILEGKYIQQDKTNWTIVTKEDCHT